jgi:Zn-dependent protease with chaperone function
VTLAIILLGFLLLTFPGVIAGRAWRCPPAEWSRVTALSLALGAATVYVGLVLTALPTLLEGVHLDGVASICGDVLRRLTWAQEPVGWAATVLSVALPVLAVIALLHARRSARRAHIEPWLGEHIDQGEFELVVVPVRALVAVGVPGRRPQIVISTGLVSELDEPRLSAVIRHEAAHHRLRHRRYLLLASVIDRAFGVVPFVGRSTHTLRDAIEQWADAAAVGGTPAAASNLRAAILAVARAANHDAGAYSRGQLAVRAERLQTESPRGDLLTRGFAYLPAGALGMTTCAMLGVWVVASHHLLVFGGYCPT